MSRNNKCYMRRPQTSLLHSLPTLSRREIYDRIRGLSFPWFVFHFSYQQKLCIGKCISILAMMSITNADHEYRQTLFTTSENCLLFDPNPLSVRAAMSSVSCSLRCAQERRCKSANFVEGDKSCSFLDKTDTTHAHLVQCGHFGAVHLKKVGIKQGNKHCFKTFFQFYLWKFMIPLSYFDTGPFRYR